jgi:hypothetical protein
MNDCGAKSKLSAPLIDLSKAGNYSIQREEFSINSVKTGLYIWHVSKSPAFCCNNKLKESFYEN